MIVLAYTDELVPYVRVGRERWTPRARRYMASQDALSMAIRLAARRAGRFEPDEAESWSLTLTIRRRTRHRYDLDNAVKAVLDAANQVIWVDDTQVAHITADKGQPGADSLVATFAPLPR